jgi:hypothetical protein
MNFSHLECQAKVKNGSSKNVYKRETENCSTVTVRNEEINEKKNSKNNSRNRNFSGYRRITDNNNLPYGPCCSRVSMLEYLYFFANRAVIQDSKTANTCARPAWIL